MNGERSRLEADALMEIALTIASERPLVAVLHRLLDLVVGLTGASRGAVISIDADGSVRDLILSGPDGRLPSSTTAEVVRALLHDTRSSRLHGLELPSASLGFPVDDPPVTSLIGSQIRALNRCYGCTYLADKRGESCFTDEDERLVAAMAAQAGIALANLQLAADVRRDAAWRGAVARVATAVRAGGPVRGFLGEVAAAARTLADADLALVIGPGDGLRLPTVLAADGDGAGRLLGLPARRACRLPETGPAIVVRTRAGLTASQALRVTRMVRRPGFDAAMSDLVERFWEQAANMIDHVAMRSIVEGPAGPRRRRDLGLHDDVVQTLFGTGMEIEAVAQRVGEEDLAQRLRGAASNLDWLIDRVRHHDERTLTPFS
jgi:GAF domain-containing protein